VRAVFADGHGREPLRIGAQRREDAQGLGHARRVDHALPAFSQRTRKVKGGSPASTASIRGMVFFGIISLARSVPPKPRPVPT
jgi:hypothetical protein